jgi:hypothetical protein
MIRTYKEIYIYREYEMSIPVFPCYFRNDRGDFELKLFILN